MTSSTSASIGPAELSRDVLDRLFEGCQVIGFDWTYVYLNEVAAAHMGAPPRTGETMMVCVPGIEHTAMFAVLRRCMAERCHDHGEHELTRGDGSRIALELRLIPVPQGVCILSSDITSRRAPLAAIAADSDDAITGRTLEGIVTSWNYAAERLFGYTAAEMIGQHFGCLLPPAMVRTDDVLHTRLASGERVENYETVRVRKDGTPIEVSTTVSPYRDATGAIVGVSAITRDITERKKIQREVAAAKDSAESANRELEAFAYSVAHDLRAPLRHIDGFSLALLEDFTEGLGDDGQRYLRRIRDSTQFMARLIDDLLKLSRVTRQDLLREPVDLTGLAYQTFARLQQGDPARRVELVIEHGLTAIGDGRLIGVVIDNLLGNAWKFTSKRERARIELGVTLHNGVACHYVRDNGVGFDVRYASRLFAPFQRLHDAAEFEGTGIGLATVQRIVHRHGGRVWAESHVGDGATFYFTLGDAPP